MLNKIMTALSAAIVLGSASVAFADPAENKYDIYPWLAPVAQRQVPAGQPVKPYTAEEEALFLRVTPWSKSRGFGQVPTAVPAAAADAYAAVRRSVKHTAVRQQVKPFTAEEKALFNRAQRPGF